MSEKLVLLTALVRCSWKNFIGKQCDKSKSLTYEADLRSLYKKISLEVFKHLAFNTLVKNHDIQTEWFNLYTQSWSMHILYMSYDLAKAEWEKAFATTFFARILICYSRVWIRVINWRFLFELKRPLESQRWSTVKDAEI